METTKPTRYQALLMKERALEKILSVIHGHHIVHYTLENIPGMGKDSLHFHRAGDNAHELALTVWKNGLAPAEPVLSEQEERIAFASAQAAHEVEKEMRYGRAWYAAAVNAQSTL